MKHDTFEIKDWNDVFETYRSREVKELKYVQLPVRRHSDSFRCLARTADGLTAYGVFMVLVAIAATCPRRGVLADDKGPWTPDRVAVRMGIPVKIVAKAISRLADPEIGWLVRVEVEQPSPSKNPRGDTKNAVGASTAHDAAPTPHRPYARAPAIQAKPRGEETRTEEPRPATPAPAPVAPPRQDSFPFPSGSAQGTGAPPRRLTPAQATEALWIEKLGIGTPYAAALARQGCTHLEAKRTIDRAFEDAKDLTNPDRPRNAMKCAVGVLRKKYGVRLTRRTRGEKFDQAIREMQA